MSDTDRSTDMATPAADRRGRVNVGLVMTGAALMALGAAWLLDATDAVRLQAALVLPGLLILVGLVLMIGSFERAHPGLVTIGSLLTVATLFSALAPAEALQGGVGDRRYLVGNEDDLHPRYEVGLGNLTLDLSQLQLTQPRTVRVAMGAGDLVVIVPDQVEVRVEASVGAGEAILFDQRTSGLSLHRTARSDDHNADATRLNLDLQLGAGTIEVR